MSIRNRNSTTAKASGKFRELKNQIAWKKASRKLCRWNEKACSGEWKFTAWWNLINSAFSPREGRLCEFLAVLVSKTNKPSLKDILKGLNFCQKPFFYRYTTSKLTKRPAWISFVSHMETFPCQIKVSLRKLLSFLLFRSLASLSVPRDHKNISTSCEVFLDEAQTFLCPPLETCNESLFRASSFRLARIKREKKRVEIFFGTEESVKDKRKVNKVEAPTGVASIFMKIKLILWKWLDFSLFCFDYDRGAFLPLTAKLCSRLRVFFCVCANDNICSNDTDDMRSCPDTR